MKIDSSLASVSTATDTWSPDLTASVAPPLVTAANIFAQDGQLRFMALLASGAYHLRANEVTTGSTSNDPEAVGSIAGASYVSVGARLQLLTAADLPTVAPQSVNNPNFPVRGLENGIYTNGNAAALVGRSSDALFLSFRGTNDNGNAFLGGAFGATPDTASWSNKSAYYALMAPLFAAIDAYVANPANTISTIYVTGHSLGGSMVQEYMQAHAGDARYQAVTFGSLGYGTQATDTRITNIVNANDVTLSFFNTNLEGNSGDRNTIANTLDGLTNEVTSHSIDLYLAEATFLRAHGLDVASITGTPNYDSIVMAAYDAGVTAIGSRADQLNGTAAADMVLGGDGNDVLSGLGGNDILYGDTGADYLDGGSGTDTLYGGDANDNLNGAAGSDLLYGDAGNDFLYGGLGADTLYGGDGNDNINSSGTDLADTAYGGNGDDFMYGGDAGSTMYGDAGNDNMTGGGGIDNLLGGDGSEFAYGGAGNDAIYGGNATDLLYGGDGNDNVSGDAGTDFLYGGLGANTLLGGADGDYLFGGSGTNVFFGGDGNDFVLAQGQTGGDIGNGEAGDDYLFMGDGTDSAYGGDGTDALFGGGSADILNGGAGQDYLWGGAGNDQYQLWMGNGTEVVYDWAAGDRIQVATALYANFTAVSAGHIGYDAGSNTTVIFTPDASSYILLLNTNSSTLTAASFNFV
jgi:Ca2+-binding RTX toxin-like protein